MPLALATTYWQCEPYSVKIVTCLQRHLEYIVNIQILIALSLKAGLRLRLSVLLVQLASLLQRASIAKPCIHVYIAFVLEIQASKI